MAMDENIEYDINGLSDIEDLDNNKSLDADYYTGSALCVPQDPIETLEWYPNFTNNLMSMNDFDEDEENILAARLFSDKKSKEKKRAPLKDINFDYKDWKGLGAINFAKKKKRTKRTSTITRTSSPPSFVDMLGLHAESESESEQEPEERRRCTHCQTSKTPQWRMGPDGPKTLCNACGVRYKSGRLLEEYRPAASPTFNREEHSNFHKRVLILKEDRKKSVLK